MAESMSTNSSCGYIAVKIGLLKLFLAVLVDWREFV
jgi:hypothetical protein